MKRAKIILNKLLHPPVVVIIILPLAAFSGLIYVFAREPRGAAAYVVYALSAYSLVILIVGLLKGVPKLKNGVRDFVAKKSQSVKFLNNYFSDSKFRGNVSLYQGAIIDAFYTLFKFITGIIYSSVWFIALAVYHLFLGFLRFYLIICSRKVKKLAEKRLFEYNCSRKSAWFLFLLNIPMSGIIVLMVCKNYGFIYPGYVIYLSAMYTFYKVITAIINLVKYKKARSPILSSAKVVNLVAALMSVLGLQTAMITAFSKNQETFRFTINAVTGGAITIAVVVIAVCMIISANKEIKSEKGAEYEQIGK